jgi:hypothetical protein
MKNQTIHNFATGLIALASLMAPVAANAELHSKSKEIVVVEPKDLPEMALIGGNGLLLHSDNAGSTYLYIEQQQGARLAVLNVTDPARIKSVSNIPTGAAGVFDFVKPLNDRSELIRFRQSGKIAILDLFRAKAPALHTTTAMADIEHAEPLGETALLAVDQTYSYLRPAPRDLKVVDMSAPINPVLLTTITQVRHRVVNEETGTTFLIGNQGLTVIRQPNVEEEYWAHERETAQN